MSMLLLKYGNFKFCHPYRIDHEGHIYDDNNDIMDTFIDNKGYPAIKLDIQIEDDKMKSKIFRVHRLVADNFITKSGNDYIYNRNKVFNINRDKNDVGVDNLLWCNSNEINAIMTHTKYGLENCIKFMTKHNMEFDEMYHVLFSAGLEGKIFFRNRYIKRLVKKYGYIEEDKNE